MSDGDRFLMAYAGQRLDGKDRLRFAWYDVADGKAFGDIKLYASKFASAAGIGMVYEFTEADGDKIYTGGEKRPRYEHRLADEALTLMWEGKDRDARESHAVIQIEKREADRSLLREAMLPLRLAMERKPGLGRSALAQAALSELHRPLTAAERKEAGL